MKIKEAILDILENLKLSHLERKLKRFENEQFILGLQEDDKISLPLATAFLLCDMALIDGNFDQTEYSFLFSRLEQGFGVDPDEAMRIVKQAKSMLGAGRGAVGYANYLKENYTIEQRRQVLASVRSMVSADGKEDDFELFLTERFAVALGIEEPHEQV